MEKRGGAKKEITYQTPGFAALDEGQRQSALAEFESQAKERDDWFYSLCDGLVFAVENEESSYTVMLADEY